MRAESKAANAATIAGEWSERWFNFGGRIAIVGRQGGQHDHQNLSVVQTNSLQMELAGAVEVPVLRLGVGQNAGPKKV